MSDPKHHPFAGRLGAWPDPRLGRILDKRVARQMDYFPAQMEMDLAHTVMLAETGVIEAEEAAAILRVLRDLEEAGPSALPLGSGRSSLFWYVEAALIDRLGDHVGGKMHTGRSHNDIMPTVSRLTARRRLLELIAVTVELQDVLLRLAGQHVDTVMPGYTALQHGQPWTLGHYLVGWFAAFERDQVRLRAAFANANRSPLGSSALVGTSWPLDRHRTAALLGFDGILWNSHDAGFATRDYVAESLAAIAILMGNISSVCSDLYLWSSYEFGMIEPADGFSGTSSFMPQKKNAWAFDWARGAAGSTIGHFASSLAAMRGVSSTDGSLQDYPERPLVEAFETASDYVLLVTGAIDTMRIRADVMLARAWENWTTASNLADEIARRAGLSFRTAHSIVGRIVRSAVEAGVAPDALTAADVDRAAEAIAGRPLGLTDEAVHEALDPVRFIETRVTAGSVNPEEVRRMLEAAAVALAGDRVWLEGRRESVGRARAELDAGVARWLERG